MGEAPRVPSSKGAERSSVKVLALDEAACAGSPPISVPDSQLEMLTVFNEVEENIQDFHCVCFCFLPVLY